MSPPTPPLPPWHPVTLLATWFGSGLLPWVPGTWGALAALPFGWLLHMAGGPLALLAASAALFALGCWVAQVYVHRVGIDDPGAIVIDEVVGQWLVLMLVPRELWLYAIAFIAFRVFDIAKPWPVRWADRYVKGGLGVMLDDVLAAVYGLAVMAVVVYLWGAAA